MSAPERLPAGLDAWVDGLHGRWRRRPGHARALLLEAQRCAAAGAALADRAPADLQEGLWRHAEAFRRDPREAGGQRIEALAAVGEVARRTLGKHPYAVQLMGALALQRGWLAEMATGEGKTLTVALAGVLAGWSGRACHVVTANDYLAGRDAAEMAPLYQACGVSVAAVSGDDSPDRRQTLYAADVVYVTAKTLLADFLRDRLVLKAGGGAERQALERWLGQGAGASGRSPLMLQRGIHTAIVDEADSVLIDEAVTPLILSAPRPAPGMNEAVLWASDLADRLRSDVDYRTDTRRRQVVLLDGAHGLMAQHAERLTPRWRPPARREELLLNALTVRSFILRGHQYLVLDDKVVLLDELTGRMTPERTLTAGLHQAIEAREGVPLTDPNESLGQMSFQAFFRRFSKLAGTTGTAREAAGELWRIYQLGVLPVPTHRPRRTVDLPPRLFDTLDQKWEGVADEVERVHRIGRPVLVGVRSVAASQRLAMLLRARGLAVELLNAERHAEEARIVARAGEAERITIATNMAGRGTDIHLDERALARGGLHVVIAECNESARIDRQLAGRCGRQGDPGSVAMMLSLEDALLLRHAPTSAVRALRGLHGAVPRLGAAAGPRLQRLAQFSAEAEAFARRWSVLQTDDWLETALPFGAAE